jgi:CMP-N,N'-diacetyllegionaminic acid synthase
MHKGKSFLAIIPARGGSKRLPGKNLLYLSGKPLLLWTIECAKKCHYFDKVIVTSDDNRILDIAKKSGVDTILRPDKMATDKASSFSAVLHTIDNIQDRFDYVVLLQPTSPLRMEHHISEAIELLEEKKKAKAIVSVCKTEHSPLWSNILPPDESMKYFLPEKIKHLRSQDLPIHYRINGAIYICETDKLLEEQTFMIKDSIYAYKMERLNSIDIDEKIDFLMANSIMEYLLQKEK